MEFMKIDPNYTISAKVKKAGERAAWLFLAILGVNTIGDREGHIPAHEATTEYLRWRSGQNAPQVKKSIERCVAAGLLKVEADGSLVIVGWDDSWRGAMTAAERVRLWRKRRENAAGNADVTGRNENNAEGGRDRGTDRQRTRRPSGTGARRSSSGRRVADPEETRRQSAEREKRIGPESARSLKELLPKVLGDLRVVGGAS